MVVCLLCLLLLCTPITTNAMYSGYSGTRIRRTPKLQPTPRPLIRITKESIHHALETAAEAIVLFNNIYLAHPLTPPYAKTVCTHLLDDIHTLIATTPVKIIIFSSEEYKALCARLERPSPIIDKKICRRQLSDALIQLSRQFNTPSKSIFFSPEQLVTIEQLTSHIQEAQRYLTLKTASCQ